MTKKHLVIPDTQCKPGVDLSHMEWAGKFAAEKKPDVIVHIGDLADMPSLSSYDVGKKSYEGRTYLEDITAAIKAQELFFAPIRAEMERTRRNRKKRWLPRFIITLGNHEDRITRAIDSDRKLEGTIGLKDLRLEEFGWEVIPYRQPIIVDGISYCHYFSSGDMGRPVTSARALVNKKHMSCTMGHNPKTELDMSQIRADGTPILGLFSGCLTPDHRVLKNDLTYVPLNDIKVGDKLISFDESCSSDGIRSRRYKTGTVLNLGRDVRDVYEVLLKSGKKFKVTKDHLWLTKLGSNYKWTTTDRLRKGTNVPKFFDEWDTLTTNTAGWLSGLYDGEGSLYIRKTTGGCVMQLALSQKEGLVLEKAKQILREELGQTALSYTTDSNNVTQVRVQGGTTSIAKLLGSLRPVRLLPKFSPEALGRISCSDERNDIVESISYLGKMEIVKTDIDSKTMIVEGYPHHNCFYQHNEDYLGPQGNPKHRQIWLKHEVKDGFYYPCPVSLEFLRKKYGSG